jgi:hypothetical protein
LRRQTVEGTTPWDVIRPLLAKAAQCVHTSAS